MVQDSIRYVIIYIGGEAYDVRNIGLVDIADYFGDFCHLVEKPFTGPFAGSVGSICVIHRERVVDDVVKILGIVEHKSERERDMHSKV